MITPAEIRKKAGGAGLKIRWQDGKESDYTPVALREACHCAACRHELTGELLIKPGSIPSSLTLEKVEVIGTYALGFRFSDGHSTGIYSFDALWKLDSQ